MHIKCIPILLLLAIIAGVPPGIASSRDNAGMDVLLVMDSTGSMKKTDPHSLRIPAAKLFISLLDKKDRAGVISFSDSATTLCSLISVDSENNKNTLFEAIEKINTAGLRTNLHEALGKGLEALSSELKTGREKIIVLMSDGLMDTGDPEKDKILIEKLKADLIKMFVDNSIKIYALAFTGQSDMQLLQKISKHTGGFYNLALTDNDFHLVFTSIFESLKAPDMLPMTGNGFLIDNSIEEVTIVTTKDSPDTTIQLSSPNWNKYSSSNKPPETTWFISSNFDMITMRKPLEGKWGILFSSGQNNKAYVITNLNLQTNFNEQYALFGQTLDIKFWLEREGKTIVEKEVLEKIKFSIELSKPDSETIQLQPFDKGEGILESKIELYKAGKYILKLAADGKTFQREKTFTFKVSDVKESQEDIKLRQSVSKPEDQPLPKDNNRGNEVRWGKVIAQFLIMNLLLGIAVFAYFKGGSFKNISAIKQRLKKISKKQFQHELKKEQTDQQPTKGEGKEEELAEVKDIEETGEDDKIKQELEEQGKELNRVDIENIGLHGSQERTDNKSDEMDKQQVKEANEVDENA